MSGQNITAESLVDRVFGPVVKGTALLIAGGYISLRAHLNHLGISGPAYLGTERYLMEAYLFIGGVFDVLIWLALPILLALVANPLFKKICPPVWSGATRRFHRIAGTLGPASVLMFLLVLIGLLLAASSSTDLIVGDLRNQIIPERRPYMFRAAMIGATIWCVMVGLGRRRTAGGGTLFGKDIPPPLAHALTLGITLGYALTVPLIYGRELHPTSYPLARLTLQAANDNSLCGIVVLHWPEGVMLWQAVNGRGRLTSFTLDRTAKIEWGATRDILHSVAAAKLTGQVPACSADFPDTVRSNVNSSSESKSER